MIERAFLPKLHQEGLRRARAPDSKIVENKEILQAKNIDIARMEAERIAEVRKKLYDVYKQHIQPVQTVYEEKKERDQQRPHIRPEDLKQISKKGHLIAASLEVAEATEVTKLVGVTLFPHIGAFASIFFTGVEFAANTIEKKMKQKEQNRLPKTYLEAS